MRATLLLGLVWLAAGAAAAAAAEDTVADLIDKLKDANGTVRLRAAGTLGDRGRAARAAVPALAAALADPLDSVRRRASRALAQVGRPAVPELIKALASPSFPARARAAEALVWIGPDAADAVPALTAALKDREELVQAAAATALGAVGSDAAPAAPALARLLADFDDGLRAQAALALARIGPPAVAPLRQALREGSPAVRLNTLAALKVLGPLGTEAVPELRKALADTHPPIREAAAAVLAGLGKGAADAVPELLDALKDKNLRVQAEAVNALGVLVLHDVPGLMDKIREADRKGGWAEPLILRQFGPLPDDTVRGLAKHLADPDPAIRSRVAMALGQIGARAQAAIPPLVEAARDDNLQVRLSAALALASIRRERLDAKNDDLARLFNLPPRPPLRGPDLIRALTDPRVQGPLDAFLTGFVLLKALRVPTPLDLDTQLYKGLKQMGPEAIPPLIRAVNAAAYYRLGFC
jgi:HEAT repeat protein